MEYLNIGCGKKYSESEEWTNVDFISNSSHVIPHNLLNGIPFPDNMFDAVYHSHVLEHFSRKDGENLIKECFRVLKPGAVLRIAVPDLEQIAIKYLYFLSEGIKDPNNTIIRNNYEWMKLEMYDQTVRNYSGGNILEYLTKEDINNEAFVFERIGDEGKEIRNQFLNRENFSKPTKSFKQIIKNILKYIVNNIQNVILKIMNIDLKHLEIGKFRMSGEIHQWMYDRYSLADLLILNGGEQVISRTDKTSYIHNWESFMLDSNLQYTRKPDSLFIECIKSKK